MSSSGRLAAEIIVLDDDRNATGSRRTFEYEYPFVHVTSPSNTVTHEPIAESIDPAVQHLGTGVREILVEGHCYLDEANFLDNLSEGGLIRLFSDRRICDAVVDNVNTDPQGAGGGKRSGVQNRLYDYRLDLLEIEGRTPSEGG